MKPTTGTEERRSEFIPACDQSTPEVALLAGAIIWLATATPIIQSISVCDERAVSPAPMSGKQLANSKPTVINNATASKMKLPIASGGVPEGPKPVIRPRAWTK